MSKTEDNEITREPLDVVRLRVDGARGYVNTLRDQQTARGLSLVCPFPALEAEIQVTFGKAGADEMSRGTIHRIGVEDDPETGLPRLRLSVRAHDGRATVIEPPEQDLIDETSRMTQAADAQANTDIDIVNDSNVERTIDEELQGDDDATEPSLELPEGSPEPAWVGCDELPLPAEFVERMRSRKQKRVTGIAAWTAVLAIAIVGVYALARAEVVDLNSVRDYVSGIVKDRAALAEEGSVEPDDDSAPTFAATDLAGNPVALPGDGDQEVSEPAEVPADEEVSVPEDIPPAPELAVREVSLSVAEPTAGEPVAEEASPEATQNDITLLLPTRWRAEYANAYRLRDPAGVVVDVPGGLVRREGWLDVGKNHPMIRSVKAVQRETGARFVVFIHGELPRFLTVTKPGGIALRLYRESAEQPAQSEQVAVLD
jgi:hypothetical protein